MYDESYMQCACYIYKHSTSKQFTEYTVYQVCVYHYGVQTMYNAQKIQCTEHIKQYDNIYNMYYLQCT